MEEEINSNLVTLLARQPHDLWVNYNGERASGEHASLSHPFGMANGLKEKLHFCHWYAPFRGI